MKEPMSISVSSWLNRTPEQRTGFHLRSDFFLGAGDRGEGKADPSVLAVFQDYVKLMPLVAEANQMSEELKKVRAREWRNVRSGKDLGDPLTPTAPKWLHATDRDREAWRGEVLCPRPHELVTESGPTPRPSQPRPLGAIPSTLAHHSHQDHQDPRPTSHPRLSSRAVSLGTSVASMSPRSPWGHGIPITRKLIRDFITPVRLTGVGSRILLRNSDASSFFLVGIARGQAWTIFF